ncbi:DUF6924 domain-containing protein [Kitasatospora sp. NPDC058201]|uniref:DUF6924 domain-containing protein n=1 Tax=unclassified Kitasatospora TaxID=2633591 RepID=UPI00364B9F74
MRVSTVGKILRSPFYLGWQIVSVRGRPQSRGCDGPGEPTRSLCRGEEAAAGRLPAPAARPGDTVALGSAELPLVVVDLWGGPGRFIRVVAAEFWGIENNLSIANMDFEDFARAVDQGGVLRGF